MGVGSQRMRRRSVTDQHDGHAGCDPGEDLVQLARDGLGVTGGGPGSLQPSPARSYAIECVTLETSSGSRPQWVDQAPSSDSNTTVRSPSPALRTCNPWPPTSTIWPGAAKFRRSRARAQRS